MNLMFIVHIALVTLLPMVQIAPPLSGNPVSEGRSGNELYEAEAYDQAAEAYRSGIRSVQEEGPGSVHAGLLNNLGASLFRQGEFESAAAGFASSVRMAPDAMERARGFYNAGNALFHAQKLEEALEMYKEAMLEDPTDTNAKHNYEVARRQLEEQQEQDQQEDGESEDGEDNDQQNEGENESENQQDGQQDQQQSPEQQQQQQPNEGDESNEEPQQSDENEGQPRQNPETLTREEAQRMLEALQNQEEQLLREVQKLKTRPRRVDKDW